MSKKVIKKKTLKDQAKTGIAIPESSCNLEFYDIMKELASEKFARAIEEIVDSHFETGGERRFEDIIKEVAADILPILGFDTMYFLGKDVPIDEHFRDKAESDGFYAILYRQGNMPLERPQAISLRQMTRASLEENTGYQLSIHDLSGDGISDVCIQPLTIETRVSDKVTEEPVASIAFASIGLDGDRYEGQLRQKLDALEGKTSFRFCKKIGMAEYIQPLLEKRDRKLLEVVLGRVAEIVDNHFFSSLLEENRAYMQKDLIGAMQDGKNIVEKMSFAIDKLSRYFPGITFAAVIERWPDNIIFKDRDIYMSLNGKSCLDDDTHAYLLANSKKILDGTEDDISSIVENKGIFNPGIKRLNTDVMGVSGVFLYDNPGTLSHYKNKLLDAAIAKIQLVLNTHYCSIQSAAITTDPRIVAQLHMNPDHFNITERNMCNMFMDLEGSTKTANNILSNLGKDSVTRYHTMLSDHWFAKVKELAGNMGIVCDKQEGDALVINDGFFEEIPELMSMRCIELGLWAGFYLNDAIEKIKLEDPAIGKYIADLGLRTGINYDAVSAGKFGGKPNDITTMGPSTNLASRVEGAAEPGTVYVTRQVIDQLGKYKTFFSIDKKPKIVTLKGFSEPIEVYPIRGFTKKYEKELRKADKQIRQQGITYGDMYKMLCSNCR